MSTNVYDCVDSLPADFSPESLRKMPHAPGVLMCPPDFFDVVDVKNPFMRDQLGKIDHARSRDEWAALRACFEGIGVAVQTITPEPELEDMVFCANQTFVGLDAQGERVCLLGHMRHPSRRREVPHFARWFSDHHYRVESVGDPEVTFEGSGDALWHPERGLVWGGVGPRTQREIYSPLARRFDVPVLLLELVTEDFYHLDTCFAALSRDTVLIYPPAFSDRSVELIHHIFENVLEASPEEALRHMACNAAAFFGRHVVLQRGSAETVRSLREIGFSVHEVETSEFMKSGGSVFCLKMHLF